jgi:hypothetical protein
MLFVFGYRKHQSAEEFRITASVCERYCSERQLLGRIAITEKVGVRLAPVVDLRTSNLASSLGRIRGSRIRLLSFPISSLAGNARPVRPSCDASELLRGKQPRKQSRQLESAGVWREGPEPRMHLVVSKTKSTRDARKVVRAGVSRAREPGDKKRLVRLCLRLKKCSSHFIRPLSAGRGSIVLRQFSELSR